MALISKLTGAKEFKTILRENKSDKLMIAFDVVMSIQPTYEADVPDHPLEDGTNANDHIRNKPFTIQVTGIVSETPLSLANQYSGLAASAGNALGKTLIGGFGATVGALVGGKVSANLLNEGKPDVIARAKLEEIIEKRQLFTLVDKYKQYDDLVMTSLTFPKDQSTGRKLRFQFSAKKLKIVSAKTDTDIAKIAKVAHSAKKKQDLGAQAAKPETPPPGVLKGVFNAVTGLFSK